MNNINELSERDVKLIIFDLVWGKSYDWFIDQGYVDDVDNFDYTVKTFEDVGLLTDNNGIVLSINDSEFQITIVKSK